MGGSSTGLLGGVGTFLFGDGGASKAAAAAASSSSISKRAAEASVQLQKQMYEDTKAAQRPYQQLGLSAMTQALGGVDASGNYYFDQSKLDQYSPDNAFNYGEFTGEAKFDPSKIDLQQDPSYQFRLNQGINALDKSAASRGMLLSGAQQKAINNYAQDTASQEYSNIYQRGLQTQNQNFSQDLSRYQQNYNNALTSYNSDVNLGNQKFNQLASVLGLGQTASNTLASANANYANQYTGTQMQNASNLASANAYAANAQMQAIQQNTQNMLGLVKAGAGAAGAS